VGVVKDFSRIESASRRAHDWNHVPPVPPIDTEIAFIDCQHGQPFVQFAHSNEAKICKVGITISITLSKIPNFTKIPSKIEGKL
jgi:hypothetical protein